MVDLFFVKANLPSLSEGFIFIVLDRYDRNRLLQRLENLQSELHKRVNKLDAVLLFLFDVGIAVKQTGEGAKHIADLAKEISKIITQVIFVSKDIPPRELPPLLK